MEIFKWKEDRLQKNNLIETHIDSVIDLIKYSQAYLQSFNNRMIDNKLYYE